jgi:hypothetical protein
MCDRESSEPWFGLMDHLRIQKFLVMGFCIGGPFIWAPGA